MLRTHVQNYGEAGNAAPWERGATCPLPGTAWSETSAPQSASPLQVERSLEAGLHASPCAMLEGQLQDQALAWEGCAEGRTRR